jgi:ParB family transcriptional regulator, chromosome partitioning protein
MPPAKKALSSNKTVTSKTSTLALEIVRIPVAKLHPHPLNPRPWSDTYQCHVHSDKVEELIHSIGSGDYDWHEPIHVRQFGDSYQILAGHHRYCAMAALNKKEVPCLVLEDIDDAEAAIRLVARQGKGVEPWDLAHHAYSLCVTEQICSQVDYGTKTGYGAALISKWIRAEEMRQATGVKNLSITSCAMISRAPQNHWQSLADRAVAESLSTRDLDSLVAIAQGKTLASTHTPSIQTVSEPGSPEPLKTVEMEQTITVHKAIPAPPPIGLFPPIGHQTNLKRWDNPLGGSFDVVIADRTTLREEPDEAFRVVSELLNPLTGRLIVICEPRHTFTTLKAAEYGKLHLEQKLVWVRGDGEHDEIEAGRWPNNYRDILVLNIQEPAHFNGKEAAKHFSISASDILKLATSPNGGISQTLAELLLRTYAPDNAQVLLPAAFEAHAIIAAQRLNHHVTWLEASPPLFESIERALPSC